VALAAVAQAQADLERAVNEIEKLPALDVHSIALAAHALNNFLSVSRGVVELMIPVLRHHPDRQIMVWLEGLAHATDLMDHTVSQLMNNTVGVQATVRLEDVDLPRMVERAAAYYRRTAGRKGIELVVAVAADVEPVRTDRVLVAAVVDNLLSNAVKYSPKDRRIAVEIRPERDGVVCGVRDQGPGLTPDEQTLLFRPGVRLSPQPSAGEASTGYGLAIAKRFVDLLGGQLTCVSAAGQGSTFSLWLPRVRPLS
jgi:signal transduction histidine kinase